MPKPPEFPGNKRYRTWNGHLRSHFGHKVFKVPLDGGFTCPNRDGTAGRYGCTFCSQRGSGDFAGDRRDDLIQQFRSVRDRMHLKWPDASYLAYFQAFSGTYAPVAELRVKYESMLGEPGVVGLSIATRPDCLPREVVDYLCELNPRTYLWVELGLQTVHQETADRINRAHGTEVFFDAVSRLRSLGIRTCAHIINGLPGETPDMMLQTLDAVAEARVNAIKIHLLHVLRHTRLAQDLAAGNFDLMERDAYVAVVCDQIERLPADVIVQRLTGDGPRDTLIGPQWSLKKWEVLNAIDHELGRRETWQGRRAPRVQPSPSPGSASS